MKKLALKLMAAASLMALTTGCMGLGMDLDTGYGYGYDDFYGPFWAGDYYTPIYTPGFNTPPPPPPNYGGIGWYPSYPPPSKPDVKPQPPSSSPGSSSTHRPAAPTAPGGFERPGNNGLPSATTPGASTPRGRTR